MQGATRRLMLVGRVRLHVTRLGRSGQPAIVLAHGIADDSGCFREVATNLARDHHVVLVDARGHGRSEAPPAGYTAMDHARDLAGVIEALDLDRPAVLGHSMGATTALALAARWPGLLRALLLEDPPRWWTHAGLPTELQRAHNAGMRATLSALKRRTSGELAAVQREAAPAWSDVAIHDWVDATHRVSPRVIDSLPDQLEGNAGLDWPRLVSAITCPVLLLTGDPERGAIVTAEAAAGFRALVDDVEVAHLPGGGHGLRHDRPDDYLAAVRTFLATVG